MKTLGIITEYNPFHQGHAICWSEQNARPMPTAWLSS